MDNLLEPPSLTPEGDSYNDVISDLQRKIDFELLSKEPNQATIGLYNIQIAFYQKKEKKRLQLIALRSKCVGVKNELEPDLDSVKKLAKEKIFYGSQHLEKVTGSSSRMIEGNGGQVYSKQMNQIRLNGLPLTSLIENL